MCVSDRQTLAVFFILLNFIKKLKIYMILWGTLVSGALIIDFRGT